MTTQSDGEMSARNANEDAPKTRLVRTLAYFAVAQCRLPPRKHPVPRFSKLGIFVGYNSSEKSKQAIGLYES